MSAPGIDDYELSVYLTKAQLEIIKNYYDDERFQSMCVKQNSVK
jgi:hypothetical protein